MLTLERFSLPFLGPTQRRSVLMTVLYDCTDVEPYTYWLTWLRGGGEKNKVTLSNKQPFNSLRTRSWGRGFLTSFFRRLTRWIPYELVPRVFGRNLVLRKRTSQRYSHQTETTRRHWRHTSREDKRRKYLPYFCWSVLRSSFEVDRDQFCVTNRHLAGKPNPFYTRFTFSLTEREHK